MKRIVLVTLLSLAFLAAGCSQAPSADAPDKTTKASPATKTSTPSADLLEITKEGSKFDPPVSAKKIPHEAWACVMNGTVHYASMDKGDGKCPTCKMKLVQHAAHQKQ